MKTDWRKPFDTQASVLYRHDSEDVFYTKPESLLSIPNSMYKLLELERASWLEAYMLEEARLELERKREIETMRERKMVRDALEEDADRVIAKLSTWRKFVDPERWRKLDEWLDRHPQRWRDEDYLFALLDDVDWDNPIPPTTNLASIRPTRRGRPVGTKNSEESKERQRLAAQQHWENLRSKNWVHPARQKTDKVEKPY